MNVSAKNQVLSLSILNFQGFFFFKLKFIFSPSKSYFDHCPGSQNPGMSCFFHPPYLRSLLFCHHLKPYLHPSQEKNLKSIELRIYIYEMTLDSYIQSTEHIFLTIDLGNSYNINYESWL